MGEIVKGQNILERVVETYASFHSYSDTGTVDSVDSPGVPIEFQLVFMENLKRQSGSHYWSRERPEFLKVLCTSS